jgi:hypothetical protein
LKFLRDGAFFISKGSLFHSVGAAKVKDLSAKVKDLSPYDFNLNRGGLFKHCWEFLLVEYRS